MRIGTVRDFDEVNSGGGRGGEEGGMRWRIIKDCVRKLFCFFEEIFTLFLQMIIANSGFWGFGGIGCDILI